MHLVPKDFQHKKVTHVKSTFATGAAATVLAAAPGTGLAIVPVRFQWMASAAGSVALFNGSDGASIWHGNFLTGETQEADYWDLAAMTANTALEIIKGAGCGLGEFHVWYVVVRTGAGSGGNDQ